MECFMNPMNGALFAQIILFGSFRCIFMIKTCDKILETLTLEHDLRFSFCDNCNLLTIKEPLQVIGVCHLTVSREMRIYIALPPMLWSYDCYIRCLCMIWYNAQEQALATFKLSTLYCSACSFPPI